MFLIASVLAIVASVAIWKYYDYMESRSEQRHELEKMETEHEQEIEEALFEDE